MNTFHYYLSANKKTPNSSINFCSRFHFIIRYSIFNIRCSTFPLIQLFSYSVIQIFSNSIIQQFNCIHSAQQVFQALKNKDNFAKGVLFFEVRQLFLELRDATNKVVIEGEVEALVGFNKNKVQIYLPNWEKSVIFVNKSVRVIAKSTLREFWSLHNDCEEQLKSWYIEAEKARWNSPNEIKTEYPSASILQNNRVVFNIKGNTYRLVVRINYKIGIVWIRFIGTHNDYDKINAETE